MFDEDQGANSECPICFNSFPNAAIEMHVNKCIEMDGAQETKRPRLDLPSPKGSTPNGAPTMVRQSCSTRTPSIQAPRGGSRSAGDTPKSTRTLTDMFSPKAGSCRPVATTDERVESVGGPRKLVTSAGQADDPSKPLAERMRPSEFEQFVGQSHIMGTAAMLRTLIEADMIPSMVFWGPPGCGKTSLAHIIAVQCRKMSNSKFIPLSATSSGVNDIKEVVRNAKNDAALLKRKTVLFIDEIHRFNKLQQDAFLPHVENGTITLIGATTENPSFSLNTALLSRCRVFVLEKLSSEDVELILRRAAKKLKIKVVANGATGTPVQDVELHPNGGDDYHEERSNVCLEEKAMSILANLCDGDARTAINCLQLAAQSQDAKWAASGGENCLITVECIKESLQRTHLLYDKKGDEHFNCISALHKSMRGSDGNASLYWLGRMLEGGEDPLYVARRLIRFSSEDVGLADPLALNQAVATYQACHSIGMPECEVILAQCVVYLAQAPKSIKVYSAYQKVKQCIASHQGPLPGVPLHLRNAPTKLMKDLGCGRDYKYNPMFDTPVDQEYLPKEMKGTIFLR